MSSLIYVSLVCCFACLIIQGIIYWLSWKLTVIVRNKAAEIIKTVHEHSVQEGRARQRHYFLQQCDNMQVWKLGGKHMGFAFKVPYSELWADTIDVGKYFTTEEIAAFNVAIDIMKNDERVNSLVKQFVGF